jgi:hypothetical protein
MSIGAKTWPNNATNHTCALFPLAMYQGIRQRNTMKKAIQLATA